MNRRNTIPMGVALLALCLTIAARADTLTFDFNGVLPGDPLPDGSPPYLQAVISDVGDNTVTVTLSAPGLPGGSADFAPAWYFNLDPSLNLSKFTASVSGLPTAGDVGFGTFKLDGTGGNFDVFIPYADANSDPTLRFTSGKTSQITFTYLDTGNPPVFSAASFDFLSASDPPKSSNGGYFAGAKVQAIGPSGLSTWSIGDASVAPLPSTAGAGLLLLGGFGLVHSRRLRGLRT